MKSLKLACAALLVAFSAQAWAVGSLADVTVVDRSDGRQLSVYWHEGRAHVVGKPGNEYSIRIRNRQGEDVLGVVSVDGVNVITGETATPRQSGYVLTSYRQLELSGWRKNLASTAAFYFTALPDSYAARTGRPDNVGVIGVALFRRKVPEPAVPISPIAPLSKSEAQGAAAQAAPRSAERDDRLGTGHGRIETSHARTVGFERATSEPAETVAIYYDSHANLVARGVIRESIAPLPRPFPGFVPDPPA